MCLISLYWTDSVYSILRVAAGGGVAFCQLLTEEYLQFKILVAKAEQNDWNDKVNCGLACCCVMSRRVGWGQVHYILCGVGILIVCWTAGAA